MDINSIKESVIKFVVKWKDFILLGLTVLLFIFGITCFTKMAKIQDSAELDENLNFLDDDGNIVEDGGIPNKGSIIGFGILGILLMVSSCWIFSWFVVRFKSELADYCKPSANASNGPYLCPGNVI